MNFLMKLCSALSAAVVMSLSVTEAKTGKMQTVTFSPDTVSVLRNPLNGWVMYLGREWDENLWTETTPPYDKMPTSDGTTVRVSDYAGTAYIRTAWSKLEPAEGEYAWRNPESKIYRLLKACTDRGLRLAFRVVVDGRDQGQNTPMYVIDAGAEYFTQGKGNHKTPYPEDPVFQEKYEKFLRAFAADFNNSDLVDFIDAYGLGKWGESHAMIYKDPVNKKPVFDWITDLYAELFTEVPLVINYHRMVGDTNKDSWGPVPADAKELLESAIAKGYSLRHDAFGMTEYYEDWEKDFCREWNFHRPVIMEGGWITAAHHRYWIDPSGKYRQGHAEDVRKGEFEAAEEARVNMMDFRINDETRSWFMDSFDLVKRFNAEGGYRLYPDKVIFPEKVSDGSVMTVSHRWNNIGWGYCPNNIPQWNYKYKVAFAMIDKNGETVKVFVDEKAEPSTWLKGTPVSYISEFEVEGISSGKYTLAVGIVDTAKGNIPGIELSLDQSSLTSGGWAVLSEIIVK